MRKWISDIIQGESADATSQAKDDITAIGQKNGYEPLHIFRYNSDYESDQAIASRVDGITAGVAHGDLVVYQYPSLVSPRFDTVFVTQMRARGVKIVLLIHDVEVLRGTNQGNSVDEIPYFNSVDVLIVHNPIMAEKLKELGVTTPMVSQYLLDYLDDDHDWHRFFTEPDQFTGDLFLSGNLFKSSFLTDWHEETPITVVGVADEGIMQGLRDNPKITYPGAYSRYDLINHLPRGFGLAWDSDSGMGQYGSYTRYNHPHKVSLYLSHGMPAIVWDQAAVAPFIEANHLGLTISSLDDLDVVLPSLTADTINDMLAHVNDMGVLLRDGYFTARALSAAEEKAFVGKIQYS
ncbi:sugar transferase [Schleiferilactobacillus shenzhenensis]|uniref:Beta-1,6-galactofuranosyltransferase n=1 Tax=Schleiferilactobacillus shenzhenensis LY-73 TaxID=1231336 RepID=U4TKF9_9LACO|nr:sugar transferase [Schleiferilactobacillus shenzhenensis]ERL64699.1 hypothetical protein L248_0618 [Schleiferilactobacillus shenzhenensis LY-73]